MKFSKLLAASAVALALGSAQAAPTPYTLGDSVVGMIGSPNGIAEYLIDLSAPGVYSGTAVVGNNFGATVTFKLFSTAGQVPTPVPYSIFGIVNEYDFSGLAAGIYTAQLSSPVAFTQYGFKFTAAAAPVPEPESVALALAGLGVVGFVAARRRKQ